jgi:hypothetical protein
MEKLWGRFWIRTLACLFGAPPVMTLSAIVSGVVINLFMFGGSGEVLPPASIVGYLLLAALVMALPLWIAMEVLNRRWKRPLPAVIAAGYAAAFVVVFIALLFGIIKSASYELFDGVGSLSPYLVLGAAYILAAVVTTAVASPFIQRWKKRSATAAELSGLF